MATVLDPGAAPFGRLEPQSTGPDDYAACLGSALAYGLFFWLPQGDLTGFTASTFLPRVCLALRVLLLDERLFPLQWLGAAWPWGGGLDHKANAL